MRNVTLAALSALTLLAAPAFASDPTPANKPAEKPADKPAEKAKPVMQKDVTATDVVSTPATDLNIKKNEIPALLTAAEERPYTLRGISGCQQIAAAIGELDAILGDDLDLPQTAGRRVSPGRVAQSLIGSLMPFRGVIREISGANEHDRELQAAVVAGFARRSFLKGIGQGKGCRYPARSATLDVFNQQMAALNAGVMPPKANPADAEPPAPTPAAPRPTTRDNASSVSYGSRPMEQHTD